MAFFEVLGWLVNKIMKRGNFKLVYENISAGIFYDPNDYKFVEIAVNLLAEDIKNITGVMPSVYTDLEQIKDSVVIVGTIGHNKLINQLIKENEINSAISIAFFLLVH
jgi:hypothetical protein